MNDFRCDKFAAAASEIQCRRLSAADTDSVLRLLRNGWFKRPIWNWQFPMPDPPGQSARPVVAEQEDRIVGFNGLMPVKIKTETGVLDAAWSCDFVVDPDHRRGGVGRLLKSALDKESPLIMAKGTSRAASQVLPRCGWIEGAGPQQQVLILRARDWRSRLLQLIQSIQKGAVDSATGPGAEQYELQWCDRLPAAAELDELWARHQEGYRKTVVRDSAYLEWRYSALPGAGYRYLTARSGGTLSALLVVRQDPDDARIVDYVGPAIGLPLKDKLVAETVTECRDLARLTMVTTDAEFREVFQRTGARLTRGGAAGFFVRDVNGILSDPAAGWFLMDGDSDGEMLSAARGSAPEVTLSPLSDAEFLRNNSAWERLREAGGYDGLFMSWFWQSKWWRHFGPIHGVKPQFLQAVSSDGRVVAIFPLIEWAAKARRHWPTRRLQLVGHLFQGPAAMRTEYLDLLIDPDWEEPVCDKLVATILSRPDWEEYVIQDAPATSASVGRLIGGLGEACYARDLTEPGVDETRFVRTDRSFEDYLASLGSNTRRSLFHGRKRLATLGEISLRDVDAGEVPNGLDLLNELHEIRWGRPVFTGERLEFHREIATDAARKGCLKLSILELAGSPVSVIYDLIAGDRRYNLQQGFNSQLEGFKGSLGMIHFGYAIEECCEDSSISSYDLLAGGGKIRTLQGPNGYRFEALEIGAINPGTSQAVNVQGL